MESLQKAISILGGQSATAAGLGVVQSTVAGWLKRKTVPAEYCPGIEQLTHGQVSRKDLRPRDWQKIWPELAESHANQPPALDGQALVAINSEAKEAAHV